MCVPYLEEGIAVVETEVQPAFEGIWESVTGTETPEYRIYIWGSTVQEKDRIPNDVDIIIECDETVANGQIRSIEGWLKDEVTPEGFPEGIDPIISTPEKTADLVANSRVSRIYEVGCGWKTFE